MNVDPDADTVELRESVSSRSRRRESFSSQVQIDVAALSDKGKVRSSNEDHFLIARAERRLVVLASSLPDREVPRSSMETIYGMVVADGIGGEKGGEIASRLAIRTLVELILEEPDWIMRLDEELIPVVIGRARQRYREINAEIGRRSQEELSLSRMGTTLTMAFSLGSELFVVHVGDSRAYRGRGGTLKRLTRDDTVAQDLQDIGIDPEVTSKRMRHVLTNFMGRPGEDLRVDVQRLQLVDGDLLLLCSDGLTEMVTDTELAVHLSRDESADEICRALLALALDRGGTDNVTMIVARYRFPS